MAYVTEYLTEPGKIEVYAGILKYNKVTPVFADGKAHAGFKPKNSCPLYDDYSSLLKSGDVFYEIIHVEVDHYERHQGIGTSLMDNFFYRCKPDSVVLLADASKEDLVSAGYTEERKIAYINKCIAPFFFKFGFTNVVDTVFQFRGALPMLWPESKANEVIHGSVEQGSYTLKDLSMDTSTMIAIINKHPNFEEWFEQTFPNGASSKEEVLSKL